MSKKRSRDEVEALSQFAPPPGCLHNMVNLMQFKIGHVPLYEDAKADGGGEFDMRQKSELTYTKANTREEAERTPEFAASEQKYRRVLLFSEETDNPHALKPEEWVEFPVANNGRDFTLMIDRRAAAKMHRRDFYMLFDTDTGNVRVIQVMPRGTAEAAQRADMCFACLGPAPKFPCELCYVAVYCTPMCRARDVLCTPACAETGKHNHHAPGVCEAALAVQLQTLSLKKAEADVLSMTQEERERVNEMLRAEIDIPDDPED